MSALFVYYRLDSSADSANLPGRLAAAWRLLPAEVSCGLYRREASSTWMETYHGIVDRQSFSNTLSDALAEVFAGGFPAAERHLEWFEPVPCA